MLKARPAKELLNELSFTCNTIPPFDKQPKRLAKKYPTLKSGYHKLLEKLDQEPEQGIAATKYAKAMPSKGKGKSGGARIVTYLQH